MLQNTSKSKGSVVKMGINLSRIYFEIHGIDSKRRAVLQKHVIRANLLSVLANMPP